MPPPPICETNEYNLYCSDGSMTPVCETNYYNLYCTGRSHPWPRYMKQITTTYINRASCFFIKTLRYKGVAITGSNRRHTEIQSDAQLLGSSLLFNWAPSVSILYHYKNSTYPIFNLTQFHPTLNIGFMINTIYLHSGVKLTIKGINSYFHTYFKAY